MAPGDVTLFLSGDSLITRPWSHVRDSAFVKLVSEIRAADVSITNLETVIHEFKGYAQADCGGTYMASPPRIAAELKWAGFNMLAHANNHSFDYGSVGVLETLEHVSQADLVIAGSGRDLQEARAPRYFSAAGGVVGLVAMASDYIPYGKASHSRPDLPGRPGVNPLTVAGDKRTILVPDAVKERLKSLTKLGFRLRQSDHFGYIPGFQVNPDELRANLSAISEAASQADIVVASVHAHRQGPWLRKFGHQAIEHGASAVFVHGPHKVAAIELYKGRPLFYSMGDFVFEPHCITRFPAETYEARGLSPDARFEELARAPSRLLKLEQRQTYEGFATLVTFERRQVRRIRLIPVDLQFSAEEKKQGRPQLAAAELGHKIIGKVAKTSKRFGTRVDYDPASNSAEVAVIG